jgi:hypothetical protein
MVKYTLARVGAFVILAFVLDLFLRNPILSMLISAVLTSVFALVFLKKWRGEVATTLETSITKRRVEKEKLRSALAGDDDLDLRVGKD